MRSPAEVVEDPDEALKIVIDFDDTISRAPRFWGEFIDFARANGHHVSVATFRFATGNNADIEAFCNRHKVGLICTQGRQKAHVLGADVWIDDDPVTIPEYHKLRGMAQGCESMGDTEKGGGA